MSEANKTQVAGTHYSSSIQHWDYVVANELNYFEGQITKYVTRCRKKNGLQDLYKAQHFLDKYIEVLKASLAAQERAEQITNAANTLHDDASQASQEDYATSIRNTAD